MSNPRTLFFCLGIIFILSSCSQEKTNQTSLDTTIADQPVSKVVPKDEPSDEGAELTFDISYIMGKFNPESHPDFEQVELKHADREGLFLRKDAYRDFKRMFEAANAEGVKLQIRSATRNFNYQKGLWERKWTGETNIENGKNALVAYPNPVERARKILLYSSMPGTSRHHWGTDIDLNNFDNNWFENGVGSKLYQWLTAHASEYGYCQPYTAKNELRSSGYEEERWHWSYMPVSAPLTKQAKQTLKNEMITGFKGADVASEVDMVGNYVLGIHPHCF